MMSWTPQVYLEITSPVDEGIAYDKYDDEGRRNLLAAIREFVSAAPDRYLALSDWTELLENGWVGINWPSEGMEPVLMHLMSTIPGLAIKVIIHDVDAEVGNLRVRYYTGNEVRVAQLRFNPDDWKVIKPGGDW